MVNIASGMDRGSVCPTKNDVAQHGGHTPATQRSNVGHAQMGTFLAAARQFPTQKFQGKHGKQPVSRKIYEKN